MKMINERDTKIFERVLSGESQAAIAKDLCISPSRVFQIFHRVERQVRLGYAKLFDPEKAQKNEPPVLPIKTLNALTEIQMDLAALQSGMKQLTTRIESAQVMIRRHIQDYESETGKSSLDSEILNYKVDDYLELTARSSNCLRALSINTIGELIQYSEVDLLRTPNFGRRSLNEVKQELEKHGLRLSIKNQKKSK